MREQRSTRRHATAAPQSVQDLFTIAALAHRAADRAAAAAGEAERSYDPCGDVEAAVAELDRAGDRLFTTALAGLRVARQRRPDVTILDLVPAAAASPRGR